MDRDIWGKCNYYSIFFISLNNSPKLYLGHLSYAITMSYEWLVGQPKRSTRSLTFAWSLLRLTACR